MRHVCRWELPVVTATPIAKSFGGLALCLLPSLLSAVVACVEPTQWAKSPPDTAAASALMAPGDTNPFVLAARPSTRFAGARVSPSPPIVLVTSFDVLRVDVPLGAVSESGKLWNHIDEDLLAPEAVAQLRRNGFRIGLGRPDAWPPIRAILGAIEQAVSSQQSLEIRNPYPLSIKLDEAARHQTLFLYRRDETLVGATYPRSRNRLRIAHAVDPNHMSRITLEITPEVIEETNDRRWRRASDGRVERVPVTRGRVFHELTARITVPPDHFLVVGPSRKIAMSALVGAAFLRREVDGKERETILFITPKLYRAGQLGT